MMIKQAGFYRELDGHGEGKKPAPSLRDAARSTGEWDEDRILGYMESSTEIFSAMGAERDVITDDVWITGAGSLITDGTWMWPVELVHYVRRHHVALPDEFVAHIRNQNYISPDVSHERSRAIFDERFGKNASAEATAQDNSTTDGFFTWYQPPLTTATSQALLNSLEVSGLSAVHPLSDALFGFCETREGKREPLTGGTENLLSALTDEQYRAIEFACWMGYDQHLATTVEHVDDATQKLTFQLTEIPEPDREEAVAALVRTLDQNPENCLGFVIDRTGTTRVQDWDRVLLDPADPVTAWPDTLAILRNRLPAHPELADTTSTEYGPLAVFHRP
ncbi:hypothetical protein [Streptomyces sp. NBC_01446]|nr:hypothetical protein [Streptomyces sp. NBC_01446]MCX4641475.1 hypothetical protein [Streptomyces sp. NBC_01446]